MSAATDSTKRGSGDAGEYRLLFEYLRDRFSDRLVLTFRQIEDLLGFALPAPARVQRDWWGNSTPAQTDRGNPMPGRWPAGPRASISARNT